MKAIIILAILAFSAFAADDRVLIDMFTESLCPDCIQFITTSLKAALAATDFDKIANLNIWPYGNAE